MLAKLYRHYMYIYYEVSATFIDKHVIRRDVLSRYAINSRHGNEAVPYLKFT